MEIKITKAKKQNPLESTRKARILKYLNSLPNCKAVVRHQSGYAKKGEPDLFGSYNGLHFELEVKRPGEGPTILQRQRIEEWIKIGAIAGLVYDIETTKALFAEHGIII